MRSITLAHVGYDYMNSRFIHGQTFTGCSNSLMGCTQDEKDLQDGTEMRDSLSPFGDWFRVGSPSCSSCKSCLKVRLSRTSICKVSA